MNSFYQIVKEDDEINDLLNAIAETQDSVGTKFSGMSYEDGIEATIKWLIESDAEPIYE